MNYDYSKLKGRIKEKFGTQEKFAEALGIGISTLSLKMNNKTEWSQDEMRVTLQLLEEDSNQINAYFFAHLV